MTMSVSSTSGLPWYVTVTPLTLMSRAFACNNVFLASYVTMMFSRDKFSNAASRFSSAVAFGSTMIGPLLVSEFSASPVVDVVLEMVEAVDSNVDVDSEFFKTPFLPDESLALRLASRAALAAAFFSSLDNFFSKSSSSPFPIAASRVNTPSSTAASSWFCSSRSAAISAARAFFSCHFDDMVDKSR